jgi:hypothetical protein
MSPQLLRRPTRRHTAAVVLGPAFTRAQHTPLVYGLVDNPIIRDVLAEFTDTLEPATEPAVDQFAIAIAEGNAVAAIVAIARALDVTESDVIEGAGIAERTFFEWKTGGRTPRRGSQGRLWELAHTVDELRRQLPDPAGWVRADPARRALLKAGRLDQLLLDALDTSHVRTEYTNARPASAYALGVEQLAPAGPGRRAVKRRPTAARRALPSKDSSPGR